MKKVVVTGLGIVSPIGNSVSEFWSSVIAGKTGISDMTKVQNKGYPSNAKSAEINDFSFPSKYEDYSAAVAYLTQAVNEALINSGIKENDKENIGLIVGTTNGNHDLIENLVDKFDINFSFPDFPADFIEKFPNSKMYELSMHTAKECKLGGINMVIPTACAAGNYAIGTAFSLIKYNEAEIILAGGADPFVRSCYNIFYQLGAMSFDYCSPFDQNRKGMVVGEGAGVLLLEEEQHALARGANILAEVKGYGLSCDAYHPVSPDPTGQGAIRAINTALKNANLDKAEISYISAHATGTPANDAHEYIAMSEVFKELLKQTPVNGLKSMLGHCMGAASAFEAIAAVLSIRDQIMPPTISTTNIDKEFKLLSKLNPVSMEMKIENVMSNAFGFGGNVSSLIIGKYFES
jgi:3-oxoacyl-[acyl-carrier-protein] synthase II